MKRAVAGLVVCGAFVACGGPQEPAHTAGDKGGSTSPSTCESRTGGALVTIDVNKSTLRLWSTNDAFIAKAKELQQSGKTHTALFNALIDGSDCDAQWTWHVDAAAMSWPDVTTEVCDGRPSDVEGNKTHWLADIKRYCPWGTRVLNVTDRRSPHNER